MVDLFDLKFGELESLCDQLTKVCETNVTPGNHKSKNTLQHEIELKIREDVRTLKSLKDDFTKLEKEQKSKQDSVTQYCKQYEQYENRVNKAGNKCEEKLRLERQKKALISSTFDFLQGVGFNFDVVNCEEANPEELNGTYKINFSQIDPNDDDKRFSITLRLSPKELKILETDIPELDDELKKVEEFINKNLKSDQINFIGFLVRTRKVLIAHLKSSKKT